jgi:hypothetical protein
MRWLLFGPRRSCAGIALAFAPSGAGSPEHASVDLRCLSRSDIRGVLQRRPNTSFPGEGLALPRSVQAIGSIRPLPILGGLHHHYVRYNFRQAQRADCATSRPTTHSLARGHRASHARIARQITEAVGWAEAPRHIIRDRDRAYGEVFRREYSCDGHSRPTDSAAIALAERPCRTSDRFDHTPSASFM